MTTSRTIEITENLGRISAHIPGDGLYEADPTVVQALSEEAAYARMEQVWEGGDPESLSRLARWRMIRRTAATGGLALRIAAADTLGGGEYAQAWIGQHEDDRRLVDESVIGGPAV